MKIQIIKGKVESDQQITVDGEAASGISFAGIASDLWALHWDSETETGEIEWATGPVPNQSVTSEAEIDSALGGITLQQLLTRRQAEIDAAWDEQVVRHGDPDPKWQIGRRMDYPEIGDQMDMIYKDMKNSTTTHADAVEAVKTKWPKDGDSWEDAPNIDNH